MVRVAKNRKKLNETSFTSMHYDSPVTRSQTAVLDLFKNYFNDSNMFSDPTVRSVLEEELTKNPGRVMTRHMMTYRPISEIENLAKMAKPRKCRDRQQSGISPVVKYSRTRTRKSRMRKRSGSVMGVRRRSRSTVYNRNRLSKRKRKRIDHIRITINDITKSSVKPPNVTEIQSLAEQEKDGRLVCETKPMNDCKEIYLGGTVDGLENAINRLKIGKQEEVQTRQISGNGIIYAQRQDQCYPSRNFENNISSKKEIRFSTMNDGFNPPQPNKDRTHMMNNIMLGQNQHELYASRTLEEDKPLWNDTRFGNQTNTLTSGRNAEQDIRNEVAAAQELLKSFLLKSDETGIHCKQVYDYSNIKNREMKVMNDCEKPKTVSLWFGNAVSSVSSYVTKYMSFRY